MRPPRLPPVLRGVLLAGAVTFAVAVPAAGQSPAPSGPRVVAVDDSGAPMVEVVVSTETDDGVPSFVAEVDGTERPVAVRPVVAGDLAVGIVVDNPPSLPAADLRALRAAALELVLTVPPGTPVAVVGTAGPDLAMAEGAAGAVTAVARLAEPERPEADPRAAVASTIEAVGERGAVPATIVLIAPGGAATGGDDGPEIARLIESVPSVVSVLTLGPTPAAWLADVEASPGGLAVSRDPEGLREAARALGSRLATMHVVTVETEAAVDGPITIRVEEERRGAAGQIRLVVGEAGGDGSDGRRPGAVAIVTGACVLAAVAVAVAVVRRNRRRRRRRDGPRAASRTSTGRPPVRDPGNPPRRSAGAPTRPPGGDRPTNRPDAPGRPGRPLTPSEERLLAELGHRDQSVRRRAAQLAGHGPPPAAAIRDRLVDLLEDEDPVAEMAAYSLGEQGQDGAGVVDALCRMARHHRDARCREAAVTALGAIGAGRSAILDAAGDHCAAVRRRAVIALAPFDGPEVDQALQRAAVDGDVEVRQAAEELSGR